MKNCDNEIYAAGSDFTSDSFIIGTNLIHRKLKIEFICTPTTRIQRTSSTYHSYDLSTSRCISITSKDFYELLNLYNRTGGITKKEEEYLYDRVIDNNFVMYCLLTSDHM